MSLKAKPKTTPTARERSVTKRPSVQQTAPSNAPDFDELLDQLAMHLDRRSKNPRKDAEAVLKLVSKIKIAVARSSNSKTTPEKIGEPTHERERNMITDDRHLKSKTALEADRLSLSSSLAALLATVLDKPEQWLATPNHQFGGRKPRDLVGTAEEAKIFDLLHAVDQGLF